MNEFLIKPNVSIEKLIAQVDISFSNSMIEAVNKKMKYEFLFRKQLFSIQDVTRALENDVIEYNNRPSGVLFGCSPVEVLGGALPDKHRFASQIRDAAKGRPAINRAELCGVC